MNNEHHLQAYKYKYYLARKKNDRSIAKTAPALLSEMDELLISFFNVTGYLTMYFFPFLTTMPLAID